MPDWALFLDVDGTLVDIASDPDAIRLDPRVPVLLAALTGALGGAVAIVSGRAIDELDRLLGSPTLPVAGQHGLERRTAAGVVERASPDREALIAMAEALDAFVLTAPGIRLEKKEMSVALHYRQAPEREDDARTLVVDLVERHGESFHVQEGKMVLEIKPKGVTKGTAVEAFLEETPFKGRIPVFIGDDLTDEDGFLAAHARGGLSILVGDRSPTGAHYRVRSVAALHDWLETVSDTLKPQTED